MNFSALMKGRLWTCLVEWFFVVVVTYLVCATCRHKSTVIVGYKTLNFSDFLLQEFLQQLLNLLYMNCQQWRTIVQL